MREPSPHWKNKVEQIYKNIELKISFVKELWNDMEKLGPPDPKASPEDIAKENAIFEKHLEKLKIFFPEAENKAKKFIKLEKERGELLKKLDKTELETQEYKIISEELNKVEDEIQKILDDTTLFFIEFEQGLENAKHKREEIRKILLELGEIKPSSYKKLAEEYILPKGFIDYIDKIIPKNFSITFIVEPEKFKEYFGKGRLGLHWRGTIWNFVRGLPRESLPLDDVDFIRLLLKDENFIRLLEKLKNTINHENFHSFIDCFSISQKYRNLEVIKKIKKEVNLRIRNIKNFLDMGYELLVSVEKELLTKRLKTFMDLFHEELMAEIVSAEHQYRGRAFFTSTFFNICRKFCDWLEKIRKKEELEKYPEIDAIIKDAISYIDPKK
jgi:RNA polymerase-binding transcription factor DksA